MSSWTMNGCARYPWSSCRAGTLLTANMGRNRGERLPALDYVSRNHRAFEVREPSRSSRSCEQKSHTPAVEAPPRARRRPVRGVCAACFGGRQVSVLQALARSVSPRAPPHQLSVHLVPQTAVRLSREGASKKSRARDCWPIGHSLETHSAPTRSSSASHHHAVPGDIQETPRSPSCRR